MATEHVNDAPALVVDLVAIARRVNDVEAKTDTVLNNNYTPHFRTHIAFPFMRYAPCETG